MAMQFSYPWVLPETTVKDCKRPFMVVVAIITLITSVWFQVSIMAMQVSYPWVLPETTIKACKRTFMVVVAIISHYYLFYFPCSPSITRSKVLCIYNNIGVYLECAGGKNHESAWNVQRRKFWSLLGMSRGKNFGVYLECAGGKKSGVYLECAGGKSSAYNLQFVFIFVNDVCVWWLCSLMEVSVYSVFYCNLALPIFWFF